MKKLIDFIQKNIAPKLNSIMENPWMAGINAAMMKVLPFIFVGSFVSLYNVLGRYITIPNMDLISTYSFGLIGLFLSFLTVSQILEKLGKNNYSFIGGLTGLALFLMFIHMQTEDVGTVFDFGRFGPSGMFVGMVTGIIVAIIFNLWSKVNFMKESTTLPDFVAEWFNNIVPIVICLFIGNLTSFIFEFDMFGIIYNIFSPIINFGQTLPGFILVCFIPAFVYSLGLSTWICTPFTRPIRQGGIALNMALVAAGAAATAVTTDEVMYTCAFIALGGTGATLPLVLLMNLSKSKELKTKGRIFLLPSLFNINEPVVFGAPIAYNPILMIPMWVNSIIGPIIVYITLHAGLVKIPDAVLSLSQSLPIMGAWLGSGGDWRACIFYVLMFIIYLIIWYPFFVIYEKNTLEKENKIEKAN